VLRQIRRVCANDALLEVVLGLDPVRDASEIERLQLQSLTLNMIDTQLTPIYLQAGFEITERGILPAAEWPEFKTTWSKKLHSSPNRSITYFIAQAKG